MSAERNLVYAMDASGRTFLKPKPVIARELLHKVHFDVDTPNAPVGKLDVVEQRRVAIARARLRGRGADRRRAHGAG